MQFYAIVFFIITQIAQSFAVAFDHKGLMISLTGTLAFILIDEIVTALREIKEEIKKSREHNL